MSSVGKSQGCGEGHLEEGLDVDRRITTEAFHGMLV